MMPLETCPAPAPGAALRPFDQAELLRERGRVPRRARADPPGAKQIEADLKVAAKTGELGVLAVPTNLFHDELPVLKTLIPHQATWDGGFHSIGGAPLRGSSDGLLGN
jgi:hypothetical protein